MTIQELEKFSPALWNYDMKDQLKNHIYSRSKVAFEYGDRNRDLIKDLQALKKYQDFIRKKFIENIGGLPDSNTPLNPEITGKIKEKDITIEKIIFQSRP